MSSELIVPYTRGLHDLGGGCYAWLEPPGSWGLANSGIVLDGTSRLIIDTQNDMHLGRALHTAVQELSTEVADTTVVNTHADSDHWSGNVFYDGARIVASEATFDEMRNMWLNQADLESIAQKDTAFGRFVKWRTETFDYTDWRPVYPTETFLKETAINVGNRVVELIQVGPAHTRGDTIVNVPHENVVYAGDILFVDSTPIIWAGPLSRCIAACDRIVACEPRVVVPGHGPVTDVSGVIAVRDYLQFILDYASSQFDLGHSPRQAYDTLNLGHYSDWPHASRAYQNIIALYKERDPENFSVSPPSSLEVVLTDDNGNWRSTGQCGHSHSS